MKKNNELFTTVLSYIPYIIYVLVIFPILGRLSYNAYLTFGNTSVASTNTIIAIIIFLINIIILLTILYCFNLLTKFKLSKYLLVGGVIFIYTLVVAIVAYMSYSKVDLNATENLTKGALYLKNYTQARGIFIAYTVYFILTIFVNKIAVISIKNKGVKSSR